MKLLLIILSIFISTVTFSQKWNLIEYVLNKDGHEVAKRIYRDSTWIISDPDAAMEVMYKQLKATEEKYLLALAILKLLDINGNAVDKRKYNEAVTAFNNFKKQQ